MKKIFISHTFWVVYSILYFILMMAACIIAEGHMICPSPVDKYTSHILLYFFGPFLFVYGVFVTTVGLWKNKYT